VVGRKKDKVEKLLTEVELEMMNVIWDLGPCTVKDVQGALLAKERELAYTSVATMMKILEQKGFLKSEKSDRAHTYLPAMERDEYEAMSVRHLSENVFRGNPRAMVMRLLDETDLNSKEIAAIRSILEKGEKK